LASFGQRFRSRRAFLWFVVPAAGAAAAAVAVLAILGPTEQPGKAGSDQAVGTEASGSTEAAEDQAAELPVPEFSFRIATVRSIATSGKELKQSAARDAAEAIGRTLSDLYRSAFLDPAAWRDGRFQAAWALFDPRAGRAAREDAATLTLGLDAGAIYRGVLPQGGSISVRILLGPAGKPFTAVATTTFRARGTKSDGGVMLLLSKGEYFLQRAAGGWRIFGYEVERLDHPVGEAG
jgi:hypothetical protein